MSPLRMRRRRPRSSSFLLVALGALTGLAVGAVIADRVGGLDALMSRGKARLKKSKQGELDHDEMAMAAAEDSEHHDQDYADEGRHQFEFADDDDDDSPYADEEGQKMAAVMEREREGGEAGPDETELEERVLEAFHNDPVLAERAIDIGAIGTGVIELTGWVQASWEIAHAVTLARGVPDVTTVVDRLAVRDGEKRRDHSGRHYSGDTISETAATEIPTPRAD